MKYYYPLIIITILGVLPGCGGSNGGANFTIGSGRGSGSNTGTVSFGISDAPVEDSKEVVIEVDRLLLKKAGASDVVVSRFNGAGTIQLDLFDYQGTDQAIVIDELKLTAGEYTAVWLEIIDGDSNRSYVMENDDQRKAIILEPGANELRLGGFTVEGGTAQTFTIEFNLRHALTYDSSNDRYILKPRGVHILENATAATLAGEVDSSLFNTVSPCSTKEVEPTAGNVVYLYEGHDLDTDDLADVFDPAASSTTIPTGAVAPFMAMAPVQPPAESGWEYDFGFVPAGDYTLAFSCNAAGDDPEDYDGITTLLPTDQIVELTLQEGVGRRCNLPISSGVCTP